MSDKHNDSRLTTINKKPHSIRTFSLEASSGASSSPIKIPSRSSGNAHNSRIPSPSTECQIQQTVKGMLSSTLIQNTGDSYSSLPQTPPNANNHAEVECSASPKSKSIPKKLYNYIRGHLSSSTEAPDVPTFACSHSPSNSEPTSARSRTSQSSASSPPGSARDQNEVNRKSLEITFNENSQNQTDENEIILDGIELSPPENRPLESLVKRFEDASIQVDNPYTRKSNSQRPDEVSRASSDTSSGAQSRLSGQTTNAPVETELQLCPQNEGSSSISSLIPGHTHHPVDRDVGIGTKEGQQIFPRMKHKDITHYTRYHCNFKFIE